MQILDFYDVEKGISRGLWLESFPTDLKGKKPSGGQHLDVGTISTFKLRPPRYRQSFPYTFRARSPYTPYPRYQYRSSIRLQAYDQTYLYFAFLQPCYATQAIDRPPIAYSSPRASHTLVTFIPRPQR